MNSPVYTLTGNLLNERTLVFDHWKPGKTQRAQAQSFQVGGKGINVSKMLSRLGETTTALCFAGGAPGNECLDWLQQQPFHHRAFPTSGATRVGVVIRSPGELETTFLGPDQTPDERAVVTCCEYLHALPGRPTLALCGSFPGWNTATVEPLRRTLAQFAASGQLVVDSYGPPLRFALENATSLVKINRDEFDQLFEKAELSTPLSERLSLALQRWPVAAWIVTDGAKEVWYSDRKTEPARVNPPKVQEISATGSGDVFLACVLHALISQHLTLAAAVHYALPFAAANAAHPGVAEFSLNNLPG